MLIIAQITVKITKYNYTIFVYNYTTRHRHQISGLDTLHSSLISSKNITTKLTVATEHSALGRLRHKGCLGSSLGWATKQVPGQPGSIHSFFN